MSMITLLYDEKLDFLTSQFNNVSQVEDLIQLLLDEQVELVMLQVRLIKLLKKRPEAHIENLDITLKILKDQELLKLFLTSGDVLENRWCEALNIVGKILMFDPRAFQSGYYKKLAVAVALTFSTPVTSNDQKYIDPVERYTYVSQCAEEEKFYPIHKSLSTWQLRFVVGSWCGTDELEFARNIVPEQFNNHHMIGESTHSMVEYKEINDKGHSIHDGSVFYDNKLCTLQVLHEYGAVCGGVAKFAVGMCQAFGVPACPIAQPGHCAFMWWKEGEWVMGNSNFSVAKSNTHDGIQWTWNKRCDYQLLFDKANKSENYVLSEILRWCVKFFSGNIVFDILGYALDFCEYNYLVWQEMVKLAKILQLTWDNQVVSTAGVVSASVEEKIENVLDGTESEWYCKNTEAWIEIDLLKTCFIHRIEIQWWGISWAKSFQIFVQNDKLEYDQVADQNNAYETPSDYNEYTKIKFNNIKGRIVKFQLQDGQLDPWNMNIWFGIRMINIYGLETDENYMSISQGNAEKWIVKTTNQLDVADKELISSCAKLKASNSTNIENLIDGTDSEWYCYDDENCWIIMDFKNVCKIDAIAIQWWGISWSKQYEIFISDGGDDNFVKMKSKSDELTSPQDYNEWSTLNGWNENTQRIKFVFKDGQLDPWQKGVLIGIRQLNVYGKELSSNELMSFTECLKRKIKHHFPAAPFLDIRNDLLVSVVSNTSSLLTKDARITASERRRRVRNLNDDSDSHWWITKMSGWIELEFKELCRINLLELQWWGISISKTFKVLIAGEDGVFVEVANNEDAYQVPDPGDYNEWTKFHGWSKKAKKLRLELKNGCLDPWFSKYFIGLRCVNVKGNYIS